ncbi:RdgB/HAM1 family non-canonical purine NTP pyrophosphatase [Clostridium senegalense]|uniref:RdgB/HAM1 family non-canonical purine NTP pyrophosphatase n=1 Tax=Clostridium senegalense TaxID=1465809 RepID=UPI000289FF77|nr:RdgB/HAM1 family non-canonical purine NTP pyrophosphatase [Clostridium senegalense]MBU5226157.1 RdgB/HAM1 family non-canonical purine NTP pyrophosphatase [Clostridium senegalense]
MKKIIVASNNNHKIEEIKEMLKDFSYEIIGLKEAGIEIDIEENGKTFMENSYIKAKAIYDLCKGKNMVLADDSGLAVDALNGAPGIYSARYSGEHGNSIENNKKLIRELQGVPFEKRDAAFLCAMVLIVNDNTVVKVEGKVDGKITEEYREIEGAFGYDPLFYVEELEKTFGEVSSDVKNAMSHRGRALEQLKKELNKI